MNAFSQYYCAYFTAMFILNKSYSIQLCNKYASVCNLFYFHLVKTHRRRFVTNSNTM